MYAHFAGVIYLTVVHRYELCGLTKFTQVLEQCYSILCTIRMYVLCIYFLSSYLKIEEILESFFLKQV